MKSHDNVHISKRLVLKLEGEWGTKMQGKEDGGQQCVCLKAFGPMK